jgi:hypothetical protein
MTDIVERLRAAPCDTRPKYDFQGRDIGGDHPDLHEQAADEIERLRSALERIIDKTSVVESGREQVIRQIAREALKDD